jgi:hypothetical protein
MMNGMNGMDDGTYESGPENKEIGNIVYVITY